MPDHVLKLVDNFPQSRAAVCNGQRIERTREDAFVERTRQLTKSLKGKYVNATWYVATLGQYEASMTFFGLADCDRLIGGPAGTKRWCS